MAVNRRRNISGFRMIKDLICIECPRSCVLRVCVESCRVVRVSGEKCPKGKDYAVSEVEKSAKDFYFYG